MSIRNRLQAQIIKLLLIMVRFVKRVLSSVVCEHITVFTYEANALIDNEDFKNLKYNNSKLRVFNGCQLSIKRKLYLLLITDKLFMYQLSNTASLDFAKKWRPELDTIVFYWNTLSCADGVFLNFHNELKRSYNVREASFDPVDCREFGMKYMDMFYSTSKIEHAKGTDEPKFDVSLIAVAKSRLKDLLKVEKLLKKHKLKVNSYITNSYELSNDKYDYKPHLSPDEYLPKEFESRVICEVVEKGQNDPTIRAVIALLAKKKLITNHKNIIHKDYYNQENIFILGKDDESKLYEFVKSPYQDVVPAEIVDQYTPRGFLKRLKEF